ncbi:MAG: hypothetical protein AAF611_23300 [Bacteroidota bacterium]
MKKLACLFVFLISTSIFAQRIDRKAVYTYSNDIEFTIYSLSKSRFVDRPNYKIIAEKGKRFVTMILNFKNKSSEAQIVDLETIYLVDKNDNLYPIDHFLKTGFRFTKSDRKQKIKANKKQKIIVQFAPGLPKKEKIIRLLIGEEVIELKYK